MKEFTDISVIEIIVNYFEGRSIFSERNMYVGMTASNIPELFNKYYTKLTNIKKKKVIKVIINGLIGEIENLKPYVAELSELLLYLCIANYPDLEKEEYKRLEKEFNNFDNIERWICAGDDPSASGIVFKEDWHYALQLWGILYLVKCERINETYNYLIRNAKSVFFKEALRNAKKAYDQILKTA